jgi:hypothetical protein
VLVRAVWGRVVLELVAQEPAARVQAVLELVQAEPELVWVSAQGLVVQASGPS